MKKVLLLAVLLLFIAAAGQLPAAAAPAAGIPVTTTADVDNGLDGVCSLREAVIAANTNTGSGIVAGECPAGSDTETDTIVLASNATYELNLVGLGENNALTGDLDVIDNTAAVDLLVTANGEDAAIVRNVAGGDRVWHVIGATVEMNLVNITGGSSNSFGGGLYNEGGDVTIADGLLYLNNSINGGAISSAGSEASLRLERVQISRNNVVNLGSGNGGGVTIVDGSAVLIDTQLTGNSASDNGGGLYSANGNVTITRGEIAANFAAQCGGGIANVNNNAVMTLIDSAVTNNDAEGEGGGICNEGTLSLTQGSTVDNNTSEYKGGGLYNDGTMGVRNTLVEGNEALDPNNSNDAAGGGIMAESGSQTTIIQSAIVGNSAENGGGGIRTFGDLLMFNSTVSGNDAPVTGGVYLGAGADATLANVTIANNGTSLLTGSALRVTDSVAYAVNSIFSGPGATCGANNGGTLNSGGANVVDDATCFNEVDDIPGVDPLLAPLTGGYHDLLPGSPAVDAGDATVCSETAVASVDQIGRARPQFAACDSGAIEWSGFHIYLPLIQRG